MEIKRRLKTSKAAKTEMRHVAWKKLKPAKLPGRSLDQLKDLERMLSNLLSCQQAVHCVPGSQLCELSPMLGWTLVMQLYKIHWVTKLDFKGDRTSVSSRVPGGVLPHNIQPGTNVGEWQVRPS